MRISFTKWAFVLGLGVLPLAAHPCFPPGGPGKGGGPRQDFLVNGIAGKLKLTDSQKTQLQDIRTRHADAIKDKAGAALEARKAFRDAAGDPATPPAQLKTLNQSKADRTFELMLERRAARSEMLAVLTPEQRIEWDKLQAYQRGFRRGMHGGRWQGMRP